METKAILKGVRLSDQKGRLIADLIRGKKVDAALNILQFSPKKGAFIVKKVLESAIANAEHNDEQIADDLYVSACFADEGKTLRRFRPRARGRATRIRKRTCHITIIVSRLPEQELARKRAKDAQRPGSRAARVAGQQLEQQGRRRRRRNRGGAAEAEGAVDATEPVVEAIEDAEVEDVALPAEAEGIVDVDEAAVEQAEEVMEEQAPAEAADDTEPDGEEK